VKWLKDLQEERRRLEEKKEAEQKEKLERKRIFMEREAKKRVAGKLPTETSSIPPSAVKDEICKDTHPVVSDDDDSTVASTIASTVSNCSSSKRKKPVWCQSETDREAAEEDEEINLLSFVDGLDFEQYTQDLELQTLMGQVKDRIKLLEREHKKDETKLQTCLDVSAVSFLQIYANKSHACCCIVSPNLQSESAAIRARALEHGPVVDFVPPDIDDEHNTKEDETKSIANSVMSCESSIGSIHSKKSLTALVTKARERMSEMNPIIEENEKDQAISPPVVRTVTDDDGARKKEMKSINKLAFTKRNPAL